MFRSPWLQLELGCDACAPHNIGIGRAHAGTHVLLLVQNQHIRVIHAATGELLRELILDPTKNYQPTGRPPGPARE